MKCFIRNFAGYTLYLSEQVVEHFFDDYDNDKGDLEEAKRCAIGLPTTTIMT